MMKLSRLFMIALLVGTMGVIGCGDDSSSGNGNGNGGGNAGEACSGPRCANNDALRVACEAEFGDCVDRGVNVEECVAGAELACG
jgi:hypothetical protein